MKWMVLLILVAGCTTVISSESVNETTPLTMTAQDTNNSETITLAGGCFWCTEGLYQETPGVIDAVSGFAGGTSDDPTYQQVVSGQTDYREAVQVTYNPDEITSYELLTLFFRNIDPTDDGGQFVDRGYQYTTAVYYHTQEQREAAQKVTQEVEDSERLDEPIVTEILAYSTFYPAEEYHQDFYKKSQVRYEQYKQNSGREEFQEQTWED